MRGRQLDRQVTFQTKTVTTSAKFNAPKAGGWADCAADVFANVQDVLPTKTEQLDQTINLTMRPARIRIRYRDDITSAMRVIYRGRTLEIVSKVPPRSTIAAAGWIWSRRNTARPAIRSDV